MVMRWNENCLANAVLQPRLVRTVETIADACCLTIPRRTKLQDTTEERIQFGKELFYLTWPTGADCNRT